MIHTFAPPTAPSPSLKGPNQLYELYELYELQTSQCVNHVTYLKSYVTLKGIKRITFDK
jgi:hypothetical protein